MRAIWLEERGSQIVEFALIAPILIYLVLMVPVLGMAVRAWVVVEGAAREGARVLAVTGSTTVACDRAYREVTLYGQLAAKSGEADLFRRSDITFNEATGEVTVRYRQPTYLPGLGLLLNGSRLDDYFEVSGRASFLSEQRDPNRAPASQVRSC